MKKIDKLLIIAKNESLWGSARSSEEELENTISRMTTEQLQELVCEDVSAERLEEIFASVGGLHLLERG